MKQYLNMAGSFECVVETPEAGWFGESEQKKTPFIRVPLRVTEGECAGQVIPWYGWLSDKAVDNTTKRLAEAFGFDGDYNALHTGKTTLVGGACNIETEMESYTDSSGNLKDRCKVKWLNPAGGGGAKPLDAAKVQSIVSRISARSKAVAKAAKAAAPVAVAPKPVGTSPEGDDVPF